MAKRSLISGLVCQDALSSRMVVFSSQPGDSLSSWSISLRRKSNMMSESVFACVRAHQIRPSVSRAAMTASLGATYLSVTVAGALEGAQTRRTKRVPFSQLSSTLMTLYAGGEEKQPDSRRGSIRMANCWRSTRQRSELDCIGTDRAIR